MLKQTKFIQNLQLIGQIKEMLYFRMRIMRKQQITMRKLIKLIQIHQLFGQKKEMNYLNQENTSMQNNIISMQ